MDGGINSAPPHPADQFFDPAARGVGLKLMPKMGVVVLFCRIGGDDDVFFAPEGFLGNVCRTGLFDLFNDHTASHNPVRFILCGGRGHAFDFFVKGVGVFVPVC